MATTSRSDPGGGVVGFAIVFLTVVFGAVVPIPFPVRLLLILVGTVLAVRGAGVSGFGLGALALVALVFAMSLVPRVLAGPGSPDLEEPIRAPSGFGLVLEPGSTNVGHVYASRTLLGDEKAAEEAQIKVLDYYVERLQAMGWTVVSLGSAAEFKAPESDVGIRVYAYVGVPRWSAGKATLVLQLDAERCPDENHCEPARISHVEPYEG